MGVGCRVFPGIYGYLIVDREGLGRAFREGVDGREFGEVGVKVVRRGLTVKLKGLGWRAMRERQGFLFWTWTNKCQLKL